VNESNNSNKDVKKKFNQKIDDFVSNQKININTAKYKFGIRFKQLTQNKQKTSEKLLTYKMGETSLDSLISACEMRLAGLVEEAPRATGYFEKKISTERQASLQAVLGILRSGAVTEDQINMLKEMLQQVIGDDSGVGASSEVRMGAVFRFPTSFDTKDTALLKALIRAVLRCFYSEHESEIFVETTCDPSYYDKDHQRAYTEEEFYEDWDGGCGCSGYDCDECNPITPGNATSSPRGRFVVIGLKSRGREVLKMIHADTSDSNKMCRLFLSKQRFTVFFGEVAYKTSTSCRGPPIKLLFNECEFTTMAVAAGGAGGPVA
jgi:hypothetical protein